MNTTQDKVMGGHRPSEMTLQNLLYSPRSLNVDHFLGLCSACYNIAFVVYVLVFGRQARESPALKQGWSRSPALEVKP